MLNYGRRLDVILYNGKSGIIEEIKYSPQDVEGTFKLLYCEDNTVVTFFKSMRNYCNVFIIKKYFTYCQKITSLSLVMRMQVNSEKKAAIEGEDIQHYSSVRGAAHL